MNDQSPQQNPNEPERPAPRPFPNSDYVRPGIDDRPDLDKALTDEDKAAVARLAVRQKPKTSSFGAKGSKSPFTKTGRDLRTAMALR